jgi:hypothetical protein
MAILKFIPITQNCMVNSKGDIIFGAALECNDARQIRRKEAERTYRKKTVPGANDQDGSNQSVNLSTREGIRERRSRLSNADFEDLERGGKRDRGGSFRTNQNAVPQSNNLQPEPQESVPIPSSFKFETSNMFATTLEGLFHPADPVICWRLFPELITSHSLVKFSSC